MIRMLVAAVLGLALPFTASGSAVVESAKGIVRAGESALAQGERVAAPVSVATGAGSQVTLKFDDGMQIVLDENSLLRIVEFSSTGDRAKDRAVLELLRGGARVVTGRIVMENPMQFFFRTPHAQLLVERPADLSVVIANPTYITVHSGSVMASNAWGTARLAAGDVALVASNNVGLVARSELPGSVAAAMQNLDVASVGPPAGGSAAGAAPAAGTDEGMRPGVAALLIGLGVAAAVAAGGGGGDGGGTVTPPPQH